MDKPGQLPVRQPDTTMDADLPSVPRSPTQALHQFLGLDTSSVPNRMVPPHHDPKLRKCICVCKGKVGSSDTWTIPERDRDVDGAVGSNAGDVVADRTISAQIADAPVGHDWVHHCYGLL